MGMNTGSNGILEQNQVQGGQSGRYRREEQRLAE
jgi:hypothetical protein